jgi:hypothetical protein
VTSLLNHPKNVACSTETRVQSALSLIADYGPQVVDQIAAWFTREASVYAVRTFVESLGGQPSAVTAAEFILFPRNFYSPLSFFVILFINLY